MTLEVDGAGDVVMDVRLYGPGDVTGLDPKQIVRTDPRPGASSFEDNYLPGVEFARADLPWLFTPAAASAPAVCGPGSAWSSCDVRTASASTRTRLGRYPCSRSWRPREPPTSSPTSRSRGRGPTRR